MCLIAYQPPGDKPFERDVLENGWDNNHHGAGYMFVEDGKLVIRKPFFKLKELLRAYNGDHRRCGATSHFIVHFRWATHGSAKAINIHPHSLRGGEAGLVHNGILTDFIPPSGTDLSDTAWFCKTVLVGRPIEQLTSVEFGSLLAEMITERNKFVILDKNGQCVIVNDTSGIYDGKRWYSNTDYEKKSWSGWQGSYGVAVHDPNYKPGSGIKGHSPGNSNVVQQAGIDPRLPAVYQDKSIVDNPCDTIPAEAAEGLQADELDALYDLYGDAYDMMCLEAREYPGWKNTDWDDLDRQAWLEARQDLDEQRADELEHHKLDMELEAELAARKAKYTPERNRVLPPAELREPMN